MKVKKIAISAGHFPARPGAVATINNGMVYVEHELAKKVVTALKTELERLNLELDVQEFSGTLQQKVDTINRWGADIALEVHFNDSLDPNVKGTETLYYSGSTYGKAIAEVIQKHIVNTLETVSRGAKIGWYRGEVGKPLYFLKNTRMPAIISEICFLNLEDIEKVVGVPEKRNWAEIVAKGLAQGLKYYIAKPTDLPADEEEIVSNDYQEEAAVSVPVSSEIKILENELLQQLARFKDYRYRNEGSYLVRYPIPVKLTNKMIQGGSTSALLDCSSFIESFIIGGFQRILGDQLILTPEQHRQLMIIGEENKPDSPIHLFTDLGLGTSYTAKENDHYQKITPDKLNKTLAWSVFQGWRENGAGHIFLIYKSKIENRRPKHLILECNKAYNLNGVGIRNFGNFDTDRFAAILTGDVPDQYWVDSNYLLSTYPELYGVALNSILV